MREIRPLTGLRGAAALLVVVFHFVNALDPAMDRAPHWHSKLYLCVDVFFVLSGFVVTLNYHALFTPPWSPQNFKTFVVRRFARLYPLYLAVFAVLAALRLAEAYLTTNAPSVPLTWQVLLTNAVMIQSWGLSPSIVAASWSISTEVFAYLLFPILVTPVVKGSRGVLAALSCCAALLLAGIVEAAWQLRLTRSFGLDVFQPDYGLPLLRCLAGFVMGMLSYRAYASGLAERWIRDDRVSGLICLGLAAGLVSGLPDLAIYPLFPATVLVLSVNREWVAWLFGHPVLHRLGLWSYALYLLHGALQRIPVGLHGKLSGLVPAPVPLISAVIVHSAVVLALSAMCFSFIEVPGRRIVMQGWARISGTAQTRGRQRAPGPLGNP